MKIFNQEKISTNKTIGTFLLLIVIISICFYFFHRKYDASELKSNVGDQDILPLEKREEAHSNIIPPSETITPKSSDPLGSHAIIETKVQ